MFLATALVIPGIAAGQESSSDRPARMGSIQGGFDAAEKKVVRVQRLVSRLDREFSSLQRRIRRLRAERTALMSQVDERAEDVYTADVANRVKTFIRETESDARTGADAVLARISIDDLDAVARLSRIDAELLILERGLEGRRNALARAERLFSRANKKLQKEFLIASTEYQQLRRRSAGNGESSGLDLKISGDLACPVAGPVAFTDSWGAPRSGHSHQGVDMMGDYGIPLVAVASGTATYVAYDGSGGNMIWIEGDDGDAYYYMHNQENFIAEGDRVEIGQEIGTLGDTGNAAGTPHLHFEYHPGGGAAINPYPLVNSLCN